MRRAIEDSSIPLGEEHGGGTIAVREFMAVLVACMLVVKGTPPSVIAMLAEAPAAFFRAAQPVLEPFYEKHLMKVWEASYHAVLEPILANSRIDTRVYTAKLECVPGQKGKTGSRVIVSAAEPDVRNISIDGEPRPVYRAADNLAQSLKWIAWKPEVLGRPASSPEWPVYVQSHALRQLRQRVNLPAVAPYPSLGWRTRWRSRRSWSGKGRIGWWSFD